MTEETNCICGNCKGTVFEKSLESIVRASEQMQTTLNQLVNFVVVHEKQMLKIAEENAATLKRVSDNVDATKSNLYNVATTVKRMKQENPDRETEIEIGKLKDEIARLKNKKK